MSIKDKGAIVGIGYTPQGRVVGRTARSLFLESAFNAIEDAGLKPSDIDGILIENCWTDRSVSAWHILEDLGLERVSFTGDHMVQGASANAIVQHAVMAVAAGLATHVLCAYVELSLTPPPGTGVPYYGTRALPLAYGFFGAMSAIAMSARRHMELYGTTSRQLGEVAVTFRRHAALNPIAQMRSPITLEDHQNSRWVVEPLRLMDCCLVSDGARALIVTSADRAKDLRHPPVYIMGMGQGHIPPDPLLKWDMLDTGVATAGEKAFNMAGVEPNDMDVLGIYDASTYNVITQLEEYGFCKRGEGGAFAAGGRLALDGELPTNTSGGNLSECYLQGWTGLSEVYRQLRGDCGERQVNGAELGLVSNQGGTMNLHSTLVLRR